MNNPLIGFGRRVAVSELRPVLQEVIAEQLQPIQQQVNQVSQQLDDRLNQVSQQFDERFNQVSQRLGNLESRLDRIETKLDDTRDIASRNEGAMKLLADLLRGNLNR